MSFPARIAVILPVVIAVAASFLGTPATAEAAHPCFLAEAPQITLLGIATTVIGRSGRCCNVEHTHCSTTPSTPDRLSVRVQRALPAGRGIRAGTAKNEASAAAQALTTSGRIARAQRFARRREGVVAFAVLEEKGRPRGLRRTVRFPSASVVKAMLLVAVLRRAGGRHLSDVERRLLRPMITLSDNDAASAVYAQVGGDGLRTVARAAGMRKFADVGHWAGAQITAADQARFFVRIDRLVPAAHRRYARELLSSIVSSQRWGIAGVAGRRHMKIFFKGGWRAGISHQVALLERDGRRLALAVLTSGTTSAAYEEETIERLAIRVLRPRVTARGQQRRGASEHPVARLSSPGEWRPFSEHSVLRGSFRLYARDYARGRAGLRASTR